MNNEKLIVDLPLPVHVMAMVGEEEITGVVLMVQSDGKTPTMITSPNRWKGLCFDTMSGAVSYVMGTERDGGRELVYNLKDVCAEVAARVNELILRINKKLPSTEWAEFNTLLFLEYQSLVEFRQTRPIVLPMQVKSTCSRQREIKTRRRSGIKRVMRVSKSAAFTPNFRQVRKEREMLHVTSNCIVACHVAPRPTSLCGREERRRALRTLEANSPYELFVLKWLDTGSNWDWMMPSYKEELPSEKVGAQLTRETFVEHVESVDKIACVMKRAWKKLSPNEVRQIECEWLKSSIKKCVTGPDILSWWVTSRKRCITVICSGTRLSILKSATNRILNRNAVFAHTGSQKAIRNIDRMVLRALSTNPASVMKLLGRYDNDLLKQGHSIEILSQKRWLRLCMDLSKR